MLEALVSSRIRRSLLEHILTHPSERFYLRGLAKQLGLSVSPLRRELKRLERSGLLRAAPEGNILFYTVDTSSGVFGQLRQAGTPVLEAPRPTDNEHRGVLSQDALPAGVISARQLEAWSWRKPLSNPALLWAASVGMLLIFLVTGLCYLMMTNQRLMAQLARTLTPWKSDATVVSPQPPASGAMRGGRWQVVPGGFGGFSSGAGSEEAY